MVIILVSKTMFGESKLSHLGLYMRLAKTNTKTLQVQIGIGVILASALTGFAISVISIEESIGVSLILIKFSVPALSLSCLSIIFGFLIIKAIKKIFSKENKYKKYHQEITNFSIIVGLFTVMLYLMSFILSLFKLTLV